VSALYVILSLVVAQRLAELWLAARNTRRLMASGAVEIGARHYPLFILLHGSWLLAIVLTTDPATPPNWFWLAVYAALEVGRIWVLISLGGYFTTRIISPPNAPLVRRGPYRFCAHPNYVVVVGEIAALPLIFENYWVAAIWSVLNAALLFHRIRVESAALAARALTPAR